jgi:hypothetical protein
MLQFELPRWNNLQTFKITSTLSKSYSLSPWCFSKCLLQTTIKDRTTAFNEYFSQVRLPPMLHSFSSTKKKLDFGLLPMEQLRKLSVSHKCKDKVMRQRSDFHFALSLKNGVFTTANEASWFFVVLINTVSYFQQIQIIDDAAFAFFLNFFRNSLIYKMLPIGCHVVFQTLD